MPDGTLESGDGTRLVNPSGAQIRDALTRLHGTANPFTILDDSDGRFVQAYGSHVDGFDLEYCPARGAPVQQVEPAPVPIGVAMRVFEALRSGAAEPLGDLTWHAMEPAPKNAPGPRTARPWASVWLLVAGAAAFAAATALDSDVLLKTALAFLSTFFLGSVVDGVGTGSMRGKYQHYERGKHPVLFWFMIVLYSFFGVSILIAIAF